MTSLNDGKLTPYDVLYFIISTSRSMGTILHARWLIESIPRETLYRQTWDEHDEL
jgi:hypothetical protein